LKLRQTVGLKNLNHGIAVCVLFLRFLLFFLLFFMTSKKYFTKLSENDKGKSVTFLT